MITSSVFSFHMILAAAFGIINGWALDKYGPKPVFVVMGLFTCLGLTITGFIGSIWQLYISYSFLVAIGTTGVVPLLTSTISRWFERRLGTAVGIFSSGSAIGTMALAPLAAYLITTTGWRWSYITVGAVGGSVVMIAALFLRKSVAEISPRSDRSMLTNGKSQTIKKIIQGKPDSLLYRQLVRARSFWVLLVIWLFLGCCLGIVLTHIVPYATDIGIPMLEASIVLSVMSGIQIVARLVVGRISDTKGLKIPGIISALLGMGSLILLLKTDGLFMLYLFAVIFGVSHGGIAVIILTIVSQSFGTYRLGTLMGILNVGYSMGLAVGSYLGGFVFDITGGYSLAFIIGGTVLLTSALLVVFVRREILFWERE